MFEFSIISKIVSPVIKPTRLNLVFGYSVLLHYKRFAHEINVPNAKLYGYTFTIYTGTIYVSVLLLITYQLVIYQLLWNEGNIGKGEEIP